MKNLKKTLALMLALAMSLSMAACGSSSSAAETEAPAAEAATEAAAETEAAETEAAGTEAAADTADADIPECPTLTTTDTVNIIWSHNASTESVGHKCAEKFKEELETRSNGVIQVQIYPNGELGTVPENDQALKDGTIQIMSGTSGGLVDGSLAYFDMPGIITDNDTFEALFGRGTELREETEKRYNALGSQVLSFVYGGAMLVSSNKPVTCYEDLKGLNIRTSENNVAMAEWEAWGANPTPIAFSELYIALQQGLVEAETNVADTVVASKLYEQQKYIIKTKHSTIQAGIYMNLDFYNNLPDDVREMIDWVCTYVIDDYTRELVAEADDAALQVMADAGLEISEFSEEDVQKMIDASQPVYDMIAESSGQDIVDQIIAAKAALQ